MPSISRARALAYAAAVLVLLAVGGRFLADGGGAESDGRAQAHGAAALEAEPIQKRKVVVHVVGAVARPGLYTLEEGSRVDDALRSAGGPRAKAALELVNLAAPVADGQQVVVPVRARAPAATSAPSSASGASGAPPGSVAPGAAAAGPVQVNSATLEELDALPEIGPVTAQKIIDYRTAKGAFSSIEELDAVPGIGPARLEQLKPLVAL